MQSSPVIFVHIPKTAGTTLSSILRRQYGKSRFLKLPAWSPDRAGATQLEMEQAIVSFKAMSLDSRAKVNVITGHSHFGAGELLETPCFTILRDPMRRVFSLYHYLRNTAIHHLEPDALSRIRAADMTLEKFLAEGITLEASNDQTRRLSGGMVGDRESLELAKTNLRDRMAAFGILERFDESILLLRRAFRWKHPFYMNRNVAEKRPAKEQMSDRERELIAGYNELDIELYKFAVSVFNGRIAELGGAFQRELTRFRYWNRYYPRFRNALYLSQQSLDRIANALPFLKTCACKYNRHLFQHYGIGSATPDNS